jgi:hypothetical protein
VRESADSTDSTDSTRTGATTRKKEKAWQNDYLHETLTAAFASAVASSGAAEMGALLSGTSAIDAIAESMNRDRGFTNGAAAAANDAPPEVTAPPVTVSGFALQPDLVLVACLIAALILLRAA